MSKLRFAYINLLYWVYFERIWNLIVLTLSNSWVASIFPFACFYFSRVFPCLVLFCFVLAIQHILSNVALIPYLVSKIMQFTWYQVREKFFSESTWDESLKGPGLIHVFNKHLLCICKLGISCVHLNEQNGPDVQLIGGDWCELIRWANNHIIPYNSKWAWELRGKKKIRELEKVIEGVTSDGEKGDVIKKFFGKKIC